MLWQVLLAVSDHQITSHHFHRLLYPIRMEVVSCHLKNAHVPSPCIFLRQWHRLFQIECFPGWFSRTSLDVVAHSQSSSGFDPNERSEEHTSELQSRFDF